MSGLVLNRLNIRCRQHCARPTEQAEQNLDPLAGSGAGDQAFQAELADHA
jgi:hypothetical protein